MKIGILGSGSGTNFEAIADSIASGKLPGVEIAVVLCDVPGAPILEKAKKRGLKALHIPPGQYKTWMEPQAEEAYVRLLQEHGVELVALAGFMRVIKKPLLTAFAGRIINIHPSLLPAFPGLKAWEQALKAGAKTAGCTVHFVNDHVDGGPIILQEQVPVLEKDTAQTLHARIQEKEHLIYPRAIALIAQGKVKA